jgi:hypothetical protein
MKLLAWNAVMPLEKAHKCAFSDGPIGACGWQLVRTRGAWRTHQKMASPAWMTNKRRRENTDAPSI